MNGACHRFWFSARMLPLLGLLCAAGPADPPPAPVALPCTAPAEYAENGTLPHVAAALQAGHLSVLAVGSGTLVEPVNGRTDGAFPYRMLDALRAAHPGLDVGMTVHGGRGLTASDMLDVIRTEIKRRPYQLVIWQTGTVEAVRNAEPADFYDTLVDGATLLAGAGADLVLIDPQYSRFLQANTELRPYEDALAQVAAMPAVVLFHRFALMRSWVENDEIDIEHADRDQRPKTAEALHACLGRFLAATVLREAHLP